jgi:P-type Cu2+ transporter
MRDNHMHPDDHVHEKEACDTHASSGASCHDHSRGSADDHEDHGKHHGHSVEMFRRKFWVSLALTIPALIWDPMLQDWFGYRAPRFAGSDFIPVVFGTLVFFYGGWVFLKGGYRELAQRLPGMMTLISLAICVAFGYSVVVAFGYPGQPLWWELATLVTVMLLGHWIEMRSVSQAHGALQELAKLLPDRAVRITDDGKEDEVPVDQLENGDILLIRPGSSIPADGIVQSGKSSVNEAMITGESALVDKHESDKVIAGTVNGQGSLRIKVTGAGESTALAGIMRIVAQAQASRSHAQNLADRAAFMLTLVAISASVLTLVAWMLFGAEIEFIISRVVTVLVIACPHALGLAIPLVIAISTSLGARSGLLVRDRKGLEDARLIDVVVFDKTGTLTMGDHRVVEVVSADDLQEDEALRLAAAVERDSEHPIAQAFRKTAEDRNLAVAKSEDF